MAIFSINSSFEKRAGIIVSYFTDLGFSLTWYLFSFLRKIRTGLMIGMELGDTPYSIHSRWKLKSDRYTNNSR